MTSLSNIPYMYLLCGAMIDVYKEPGHDSIDGFMFYKIIGSSSHVGDGEEYRTLIRGNRMYHTDYGEAVIGDGSYEYAF